jgi:glucokinase
MFEFPALLGDIGGTNARFALLPAPHTQPVPLPKTLTSAHATAIEAIGAVLQGQACRPRSALIAVATRVDSSVVRLTNADWLIDAAEIGKALDLSAVMLTNDYVPVAASLRTLGTGQNDLARLGPELAAGTGARLVIGPGTGLGAAALLPMGERWAVQPTEAGHIDFGPSSDIEMALWTFIERVQGRITAETLLSGPGLLRLYDAMARAQERQAVCSTPEAVTQAALAGTEALAVEALGHFGSLLGRFAGDLALIFGATGGVFIGGGIAPAIAGFLDKTDFRASFEAKAPFADVMQAIPTAVIMHPEPALLGLAALASEMNQFICEKQIWTA